MRSVFAKWRYQKVPIKQVKKEITIQIFLDDNWPKFHHEAYRDLNEREEQRDFFLSSLTKEIAIKIFTKSFHKNIKSDIKSPDILWRLKNIPVPKVVNNVEQYDVQWSLHRVGIEYLESSIFYTFLFTDSTREFIFFIPKSSSDLSKSFDYDMETILVEYTQKDSVELPLATLTMEKIIKSETEACEKIIFNKRLENNDFMVNLFPSLPGVAKEVNLSNTVVGEMVFEQLSLKYSFHEFSCAIKGLLEFMAINNEVDRLYQQTTMGDKAAFEEDSDQYKKALSQAKAIECHVKAIADEKIDANIVINGLKNLLIKALKQSAIHYYLELHDSKSNLHNLAKEFPLVIEKSSDYKIQFKNLESMGLLSLMSTYNNMMQSCSGYFRYYFHSNKLIFILKNNLSMAKEKHAEAFHIFFKMSENKDIINPTQILTGLLKKAKENHMDDEYKESVLEILALLKDRFHKDQREEKHSNLESYLGLQGDSVHQQDTSKALQVIKNRFEYHKYAVQRAIEIELHQQRRKSIIKRKEQAKQKEEAKKDHLKNSLANHLLTHIDTILMQLPWWERQVKGCCGGDSLQTNLLNAVVPRGVGYMLRVKNESNSPLVTLQCYQAITRNRLHGNNWANFFNTRNHQTTQRFYELLAGLDLSNIHEDQVTSFDKFLRTDVGFIPAHEDTSCRAVCEN